MRFLKIRFFFFQCSTCPEQFMHKKNLTIHMMKAHGYPKPHAVSFIDSINETLTYLCRKTSVTFRIRAISLWFRFSFTFQCSECPKTFLTRTELRVHEAAKHRGEKPFVCEECGHRASSRNGLQMHIKAIHRFLFLSLYSAGLSRIEGLNFLFCFTETSARLYAPYVAMRSPRRTT